MTSPAGPGIVVPSGLDVAGLFTAYSPAFANLPSDNATLYQKLAFVPGANDLQAATEREGETTLPSGNTAAAQFLRFPFPMIAGAPMRWEWGQPRKSGPPKVAYVEMEMIRWAPEDEESYYDLLNAQRFGMIRNNLNLMLSRAPKAWDYMLADAININGNAYDGVPFFTPSATPHLANAARADLGSSYNDIQIPAINVASLRTAVNLLEIAPGFDGQPLDTGNNTKIIAIAPNSDIEMQLRDVFQGSIQAQALNAASGATGPNEGLRGKAEVMLWKDLRRGNPLVARVAGVPSPPVGVKSGLGVDQVFYLLSVPANLQRAFIVAPQRQPTPHYLGLNPNDPIRAATGGIRYGWYVFGGAQLALWQRAVRVQITG